MNQRTLLQLLCSLLLGLLLASCTASKEPIHLIVNRVEDTVYFSLDPESSDRWWSTRDSVVVECLDCDQGTQPIVEHFDNQNFANLEMEDATTLRFKIYSGVISDTTVVLPGVISNNNSTTTAKRKPRISASKPTRRSAVANKSTTKAKAKAEAKEAATETKTVKKATTLRVIAAEGVAVYKDKSKTEVLKILQKGEVLPYLAKEGDMYSVSVGGTEGFVEAEAVQIAQ